MRGIKKLTPLNRLATDGGEHYGLAFSLGGRG